MIGDDAIEVDQLAVQVVDDLQPRSILGEEEVASTEERLDIGFVRRQERAQAFDQAELTADAADRAFHVRCTSPAILHRR